MSPIGSTSTSPAGTKTAHRFESWCSERKRSHANGRPTPVAIAPQSHSLPASSSGPATVPATAIAHASSIGPSRRGAGARRGNRRSFG